MKKYKIVITLFLIINVILSLSLFTKNNTNSNDNGYDLAFIVDGKQAREIPSTGNFNVKVACNGATGAWNYDSWQLQISNITGNIKCNLDFESYEPNQKYISNYIISKGDTKSGDGHIISSHGYRYVGLNPNNYVLFNNELWRIVSVIPGEEVTNIDADINKYFTKIMRSEPLDNYAYDMNPSPSDNRWIDIGLGKLLNNYYYNAVNYNENEATDKNLCEYLNIKRKCDYSENGIKLPSRQMIYNALWYASYITSLSIDDLYNNEINQAYSSKAYVGIPNLTDIILSMDGLNNNIENAQYYLPTWISNGGISLIDRMSYNQNIYTISGMSDTGIAKELVPAPTNQAGYIFPAVYLKPNVYIKGGDGSADYPYVLGLDE